MGDYPLLGARKFSQFPFLPSWFFVSILVLHPSIRLSYFEDKSKWDQSIAIRACVLLEHLYEIYKEDGPVSDTAAPHAQNPAPSVFMDAIKIVAPSLSRAVTEIEAFFSGNYLCTDGNALKWWKVRAHILYLQSTFNTLLTISPVQLYAEHFPVLARIARDILAIPGVSISVERLFSSSKHTLSDARSSLSAESALKTVVAKEWLKFRRRGELSWWYLYSLLIQIQYD